MNKNPLVEKLENASETELDVAFALLKYKEIGIYRKVKGLALSFGLDFEEVVSGLPQENGRLLDRETRHYIHDYMLARAKQFHNTQN
jgi:hypothetical protein